MSEIDKLRALLADVAPCIDRAAAGCLTTKTLREIVQGECGCVACEIDATLAEPVRDDFRRGAEAMREVAAQKVRYLQGVYTLHSLDDEIRAMPTPEDKP